MPVSQKSVKTFLSEGPLVRICSLGSEQCYGTLHLISGHVEGGGGRGLYYFE